MKFLDNVNLLEEDQNEIFESTEASISSDDQNFLFGILANQYSDPIGSIVREITSNCFDSHIEAVVNKPVIISITQENDQFFICFDDFGVGLSKERISKVYMNYFSSTKRKTNDQIGGFGLGSKSPLTYTDEFIISTRFNGSKRTYLMYKTSLKPKLDLLLEEECDPLDNGTQIKIPLKSNNDVNLFLNKIYTQLFYFDNVFVQDLRAPNNINYDDKSILKQCNDYIVYDFETFKYREGGVESNLHIVIDKVTYPIDFKQLNLSKISIPLGIKFKIGDLQVTPSRESILYDKSSIELIKLNIFKFIEELSAIYLKDNLNIDFKKYANSFVLYRQKNLYIQLTDKNTIILNHSDIHDIKVNNKKIFTKNDFTDKFPTPLYDKFETQGFKFSNNIFYYIEYVSSLRKGKKENHNIDYHDLIRRGKISNLVCLDEPTNLVKNKFIQSCEFYKFNRKGFINKYMNNLNFKDIDYSKTNFSKNIQSFCNLFIKEFTDNFKLGYYSKITVSEEFKQELREERLTNRTYVNKDEKIKVEYMGRNNSFQSDWIDLKSLEKKHRIIAVERKDKDNYYYLSDINNKIKKRVENNNNFKYIVLSTSSKNYNKFFKDHPKLMSYDELCEKEKKWNINLHLAYLIGNNTCLSNLLSAINEINEINNDIYNYLCLLQKHYNLFRYKSNEIKVLTKKQECMLKNHEIYIAYEKVLKYFDDPIFNFLDFQQHKFKTEFFDFVTGYLKLKKKRLNLKHYNIKQTNINI